LAAIAGAPVLRPYVSWRNPAPAAFAAALQFTKVDLKTIATHLIPAASEMMSVKRVVGLAKENDRSCQ